MTTQLNLLVASIGAALQKRKERIVTAESCTGGWVAQAVTAIPGSATWFDRGFVTYNNDAKTELLKVSPTLLKEQGAVNEAVVQQMAEGALAASRAEWALAISGIAGPDGGTPTTPVGTVCFAWSRRSSLSGPLQTVCETCHFTGTRTQVRRTAVIHALTGLLSQLQKRS